MLEYYMASINFVPGSPHYRLSDLDTNLHGMATRLVQVTDRGLQGACGAPVYRSIFIKSSFIVSLLTFANQLRDTLYNPFPS
jgi:hypothetical protein